MLLSVKIVQEFTGEAVFLRFANTNFKWNVNTCFTENKVYWWKTQTNELERNKKSSAQKKLHIGYHD